MLKQRIITALILIPIVLGSILYLPNIGIAIIFALIILQGAWEWSRLAGLQRTSARLLFVLLIEGLLWYLWPGVGNSLLMLLMGYLALSWWIVALLWILAPKLGANKNRFNIGFKILAGVFVLAPAWYAVVSIHSLSESGPVWVLFALFLIWIADSGAYFAGRAWGKHKLAPTVSPGKTWEGVIGAFVLVAIFAAIAHLWLPVTQGEMITLMGSSLILVAVSIIGDLFESLMKRQAGIKDSGTLLPGHGGVMDRIDSLTAVMPLFMWLMILVGLL